MHVAEISIRRSCELFRYVALISPIFVVGYYIIVREKDLKKCSN